MSVESATSSPASSASKAKEAASAASDVCRPAPAPSIQVSVTAGNDNVNVEAASATMNEDEMAESGCAADNRPQTSNPENADEKKSDTDEMAIVSETMANASLTTSGAGVSGGCASELNPSSRAVALVRPNDGPNLAVSSSQTQKPKQARKKKRTPPLVQPGQSSGRWTHAEHEAFLEGLKVFGREWKKVAVRIPTRTSAQVRSHAQKYFSKLARDEQVMNQENQAYEAAASATAAAVTSGDAAASASEAPEPTQAYAPSIQRNVDRILADPEQAQRDVEDTLRALRERYRLLQQRLQEAPPSREGSPSNIIEDEEEEEKQEHNNEQQQQQGQEQEQQGNGDQRQQEDGDQARRGKLARREGDEDCSVSSASASALSSLGNEELIALSVLGGSLPNGHARPSAPNPSSHPFERSGSNSSLESAENGHDTPKRKREDN